MTTTLTVIDRTPCHRSERQQSTTRNALLAMWANYKRNRARRRTEHILAGLSDRTLKDIGFSRNEIGSVVHSAPGARLHDHDDCWDQCENT